MTKDVAILVNEKYFLNNHKDDIALKDALEKMNITADIINWDNEDYAFNKVKVAIVRSCWDYDQRLKEFLPKMNQINEQCTLINPYETIKQNCNKTYLMELQEKGVKIVETHYIFYESQIEEVLNKCTGDIVVVKPTVSASGKNTYRVSKKDPQLKDIILKLLDNSEVMIQPYIKTIETTGEKSSVVIKDEIVFTMLKKPANGNFLVHPYLGGSYIKDSAADKDLKFLNQVISLLPKDSGFVRIDYLFNEKDEAMLLELELIEPNLYLEQNPRGLELLCLYIKEKL